MRRLVLIGALVAIAGGVAWFALPDGGSSHLTSAPAKPKPAPAQPPMLDPATAGAVDKPASSPAQIYASETRDDRWATETEAEIRRRFQIVRGAKLDATDCRQTRCSITVSGSEADVGKTIADLESDRGLHGYAENILLTAPEKRPDGSIVLRAIASFRR